MNWNDVCCFFKSKEFRSVAADSQVCFMSTKVCAYVFIEAEAVRCLVTQHVGIAGVRYLHVSALKLVASVVTSVVTTDCQGDGRCGGLQDDGIAFGNVAALNWCQINAARAVKCCLINGRASGSFVSRSAVVERRPVAVNARGGVSRERETVLSPLRIEGEVRVGVSGEWHDAGDVSTRAVSCSVPAGESVAVAHGVADGHIAVEGVAIGVMGVEEIAVGWGDGGVGAPNIEHLPIVLCGVMPTVFSCFSRGEFIEGDVLESRVGDVRFVCPADKIGAARVDAGRFFELDGEHAVVGIG